jgi:DNA-binding CsgD family transcriptional regulator
MYCSWYPGLQRAPKPQVLGISAHTAHGYVKDVYRKLAVSSRAEAALAANRMGIV